MLDDFDWGHFTQIVIGGSGRLSPDRVSDLIDSVAQNDRDDTTDN